MMMKISKDGQTIPCTLADKIVECGLDRDAAEFLANYYPECECFVDCEMGNDSCYHMIEQISDEDYAERLDFLDLSDEEYRMEMVVVQDAAFDGVIIMGIE